MRRGAGLGLAVGLLGLACGCGSTDRNGGRETMSEAQEKAVALLRLPDDEYPDLDEDRLLALQGRLRDLLSKPPGTEALLALGAPRTANLDASKEIPLLVGVRYTARRAWEVHLDENALLVAVDLGTGALHAGWPLIKDKRRPTPVPSRTGPAPEGFKSKALTTGVKRTDLARSVEAVLGPSRLALTVIVYDWVSNTVVIELTRRDVAPTEVAPRNPTTALTRTTPGSGIPKLDGSGAALAISKDIDPGDPVTIGGAVDLPLADAVVVPSAAPGGGSLLVANVLIRKLDETLPVSLELAVPAEVRGGPKDGSVRAYFEFDALRMITGTRLSGEYQVYLITGVRVFGPYPLKVGVR